MLSFLQIFCPKIMLSLPTAIWDSHFCPYLREDDSSSICTAGSFLINPTFFIQIQHLLLYEPTKGIFLLLSSLEPIIAHMASAEEWFLTGFQHKAEGQSVRMGCCCQSSLWSICSCYSSCTGSFKSLHKQFVTNCSVESLGFCMQYFGRIRSA